MKIDQAENFQPITLTIENAREAQAFIGLIDRAEKELNNLEADQHVLAVGMSNVFTQDIHIGK